MFFFIIYIELKIFLIILVKYSQNSRLRRRFPRSPGEHRIWETAVFRGGKKQNRVPTALHSPHGFKNFGMVMGIPNFCLVLKLDNGKAVSILDEQTDGRKSYPVRY